MTAPIFCALSFCETKVDGSGRMDSKDLRSFFVQPSSAAARITWCSMSRMRFELNNMKAVKITHELCANPARAVSRNLVYCEITAE
jgi:hypothetical protein